MGFLDNLNLFWFWFRNGKGYRLSRVRGGDPGVRQVFSGVRRVLLGESVIGQSPVVDQ